MPPAPRPVSLTAEGLSLRIAWSDGHASVYPPAYLRLRCRCAHCVDETTGVRRIRPEEIPAEIHPLRADPVGRYAIQIAWSDRHSSGIYTFDYLRSICPCPACAGTEEKETAEEHR